MIIRLQVSGQLRKRKRKGKDTDSAVSAIYNIRKIESQ